MQIIKLTPNLKTLCLEMNDEKKYFKKLLQIKGIGSKSIDKIRKIFL